MDLGPPGTITLPRRPGTEKVSESVRGLTNGLAKIRARGDRTRVALSGIDASPIPTSKLQIASLRLGTYDQSLGDYSLSLRGGSSRCKPVMSISKIALSGARAEKPKVTGRLDLSAIKPNTRGPVAWPRS